jgi:periplasmic divalent cation tolerance protein
MTDPSVVAVLTTLPAASDAAVFARTLVEEGLAACVTVLEGARAVYRWEGTVHEDREQQLIIKTTTAGVAPLEARVRSLHPYEIPEFIVLPVTGGSAAYLAWVTGSVPGSSIIGR